MGLVDRWTKTYFPKPKQCAIDNSDGHRMGLSDIQGVFIVLALLILLATLVLLLELISTLEMLTRLIKVKKDIIKHIFATKKSTTDL